MNIEVEIKVKINNPEEIKKKVASIGKLVKAINQVDDYYVPVQRDFFANKPQPVEHLRIRTNPGKTVFEYTKTINLKENLDYDCAEEYEAEISNPGEFQKILGFLDFKKVVTVDKQREYWMCGDVEVALDEVRGLGSFIEVEAKGDFKNNEEAKLACVKFLERLGIGNVEENQVKKGYPSLIMEKI